MESFTPSIKMNSSVIMRPCTSEKSLAAGNSLVYFIAHASPEAAKTSFDKFRVDEDWTKAMKASEAAAGGPLTVKNGVKSLFLKPTAFSPIK